MASEETPLLSTDDNAPTNRLDDVYLRFSSTKKKIILVMVSGCGVINCMSICSELATSGWRFTFLFMGRFSGWDVYTFNTTDRRGPEFNRGDRQVNHFLKTYVVSKKRIILPFSISSIAISMTVFAASFGALVAASYSTFCKFFFCVYRILFFMTI